MTEQMKESSPLRLGVLGTGSVAAAFVDSIKKSRKIISVAVGSRDLTRAQEFAAELELEQAYASYAALLADPQIDAVYIALPNTLHTEWCIKSLEAGKHVICEKPLACSGADARRIYATADRLGLKMVEAYPYRAQQQTRIALDLIHSGELGRPRTIQASFGFNITDTGDIRLNPALGGGALLDAGSYPVSLIRSIAGCAPQHISAYMLPGVNHVEASLVANLAFPGGLLAQISCTFTAAPHRYAVIACEGGAIETSYTNHVMAERPTILKIKRGAAWTDVFEAQEMTELNGFLAEAEAFADLVNTGSGWTGVSRDESIDIADMLERIKQSALAI